MMNKEQFKLIEGVFIPKEAEIMLSNLINSKINYHNLDDFSNHIRFNNDESHSKTRKTELLQTKEKIQLLIAQAQEQGLKLVINSTIQIEFKE